jgi:hydroxymethylpyrimidine pyrophosphatase-like HAD family hydrolase
MNIPILQSIKLIAIDIDGTLLNPHKQIAARTFAAVRAAQEAGIIVTLATARRYTNTRPIADELGITIPLILCDGALIIEHPQNRVLYTRFLQADIAQQAADIMMRHHVQPIVQHICGNVEETWTGQAEFDNSALAPYLRAFPGNLRRMRPDMLCTGQPDPLRVVAFATEAEVYGMLGEVSALSCAWDTVRRGNYGCAELVVMHRNCSKAAGVRALAERLHIDLAKVMAIGDSTNDLEMLRTVGWGVAMGQAPDTVKASAHAITASNAEDGVALAIERYALQKTVI